MVKVWYTIIANGACTLIEANIGSYKSEYVRISRKILVRIFKNKQRRPDSMATLLSDGFAYNYIHGCDLIDNESDPLLDNLIFLCVTEAVPLTTTPAESRNEAYMFLSQMRSNFITAFDNDIVSLSGINIDENLKSHLRRFAAQIKDQMFYLGEKRQQQDGIYNSYQNGSVVNSKYGDLITSGQTQQGIAIQMSNKSEDDTNETNEAKEESLSLLNSHHHSEMTTKHRYCKKLCNSKCYAFMAFVGILSLYLMSVAVCGWSWQDCSVSLD